MNVKHLMMAAGMALVLSTGGAYASDKPVSDSWITTKVKAELTKDSDTKASKIHVNTASGVVTLTGNVASSAQKMKAEQDTKSVKGVVDVQNMLKVPE
jgi:hyperosmotically inducible protein